MNKMSMKIMLKFELGKMNFRIKCFLAIEVFWKFYSVIICLILLSLSFGILYIHADSIYPSTFVNAIIKYDYYKLFFNSAFLGFLSVCSGNTKWVRALESMLGITSGSLDTFWR